MSIAYKQETMTNSVTKITQQTVGAIRSTGSVYYIRDSELKGFAIKVTAKGQASFIAEGRIKKRGTFRKSIGDVEHILVKNARAEAHIYMGLAKRGIDPRYTQPDASAADQTLRWCLEQHLKLRVMRDSTVRTYRNQMNNAFGKWYKEPVEQITPQRIAERRVELIKQGKSENYVASCLRTLKAVLNHSSLPINPVKAASRSNNFAIQSTPTQTREFLLGPEIGSLLYAYVDSSNFGEETHSHDGVLLGQPPKPNIFAAVLYLLLIGGREQDVYSLTWDMIDFDHKTISYPARSRKENKPHVIPMIGMLQDIVINQPRHLRRSDLVFGMTHEMFRTRYNKQIKPIINQTSKSLRKTWAEHMGLDGYDDKAIGRGLNHSWATQGSVTTRSYYTASLVKEQYLQRMFISFQARCLHYALGKSHQDQVNEDVLQNAKLTGAFSNLEQDQVKVFRLLGKFPNFRHLLQTDKNQNILDEVRLIEELGVW